MAGKKDNSKKKEKPKEEKRKKVKQRLSEEEKQKIPVLLKELKEKAKTINNPIYNLFFRSGHIPGAIYDAPSARIYRAQGALRSLLSEYKPSSEVLFHDNYRPLPDGIRLSGRCLWLAQDEDAQHWSAYDASEKLGAGVGARKKTRFEAFVKGHMSRIASIVKKFK